MPKNKKQKSVVREWVESILIALVLAVLIRSYIISPFKIPSGSMEDTLLIGDQIFVDKWTYGPQVLPPMFWDIGFQEGKPFLSLRWPDAWLPLTKKRLPGVRKPQRGDIVVFVWPVNPTMDFIKRLIAVGGETVEIKDGGIYIDGKEVTDPRIKRTYYNCDPLRPVSADWVNNCHYGFEGQKVLVPKGFDFVMGDNSGNSLDSRYWGFVPESSIIGKADIIWWPLNRIRILQ